MISTSRSTCTKMFIFTLPVVLIFLHENVDQRIVLANIHALGEFDFLHYDIEPYE